MRLEKWVNRNQITKILSRIGDLVMKAIVIHERVFKKSRVSTLYRYSDGGEIARGAEEK